MEDYSKYIIKNYKYWNLQIHSNQEYLGRCVVWCKREDALDLPDATEEEQKELFMILTELEKAILKTFNADILNYAFLGNSLHHLHGHIVPRYSKPVEFEGITFVDKHYGHNFQLDNSFITPQNVIEAVMINLKKALGTFKKRDVSLLIPYIKKDGETLVFLQRRTKDAPRLPGYLGFWGGGMEAREKPEEALEREIYEEMSFKIKNYKFFKNYELPNDTKYVFSMEVKNDFEKDIRINEGDGGKFVSKNRIDFELISDEDKLLLNDFFESQF